MRPPALLVLTFVATACLPTPLLADDPAEFYEEHCASCHTIGGGPLGGPDLAGVTGRRDREWLIRFLLDPSAFANDPVVKRMIAAADGMEMPAIDGLTRDRAKDLLDWIEQRSGRVVPSQPERPVTPAEVDLGRGLFTDGAKLSASGAACRACHTTGGVGLPGGRLGPDLAQVSARLGGVRGLTSWLGSPPTPVMRALYGPAPLTANETHALAAFLAAPSNTAATPAVLPPFVVPGVAGTLAALALIGLASSRRFRAVRQPLVSRTQHHLPLRSRRAPGMGGRR